MGVGNGSQVFAGSSSWVSFMQIWLCKGIYGIKMYNHHHRIILDLCGVSKVACKVSLKQEEKMTYSAFFLVAVSRGYHAIIDANKREIPVLLLRAPLQHSSPYLCCCCCSSKPCAFSRHNHPRTLTFPPPPSGCLCSSSPHKSSLIRYVSWYPAPLHAPFPSQSCYQSLHLHVPQPPRYRLG